jgi:hypothetical protein
MHSFTFCWIFLVHFLSSPPLVCEAVLLATQRIDNQPKVFIIGQNLALEEMLSQEFAHSIVSVYEENPQAAFSEWAQMLQVMDQICEVPEYDIRGVKAFATFYWSKDGYLRYVGYALKPNSRFIKHGEMEHFFMYFMTRYKQDVPVSNQRKFLHSFTLTMPYPRELTTPKKDISQSPHR